MQSKGIPRILPFPQPEWKVPRLLEANAPLAVMGEARNLPTTVWKAWIPCEMKTRNIPSRRSPRECSPWEEPEKILLTVRRKNWTIRKTNNQKRDEDYDQSPPFRLLQWFLQPELTNHSGEKNNWTSDHLPNTDRDPQQTDEHNKRCCKITNCRNKHFEINRPCRTLILRIPTHDWN